jgi:hypothetical protein
MTADEQARTYVKRALAAQKRLGYSARVEAEVVQSAIADVRRAVAKLLEAQRPR